jgi:hypothetical protein
MKTGRKRSGRPTTAGIAGRKSTLSIRASADLKARLDVAAKNSGKSLSQEAEGRLESSFERGDLLDEVLQLAYGPQLAALLLLMAESMKTAGHHAGFMSAGTYEGAVNWFNNPTAFREVADAGKQILDAFTSADAAQSPDSLGAKLAAGWLLAVRSGTLAERIAARAEKLRAMLGAEAVGRMHFDDNATMPPVFGEPTRSADAIDRELLMRLIKNPPKESSR